MLPYLWFVETATRVYWAYDYITGGLYSIHKLKHKISYNSLAVSYIQVNTNWTSIFSFVNSNEGFQYIMICCIELINGCLGIVGP